MTTEIALPVAFRTDVHLAEREGIFKSQRQWPGRPLHLSSAVGMPGCLCADRRDRRDRGISPSKPRPAIRGSYGPLASRSYKGSPGEVIRVGRAHRSGREDANGGTESEGRDDCMDTW